MPTSGEPAALGLGRRVALAARPPQRLDRQASQRPAAGLASNASRARRARQPAGGSAEHDRERAPAGTHAPGLILAGRPEPHAAAARTTSPTSTTRRSPSARPLEVDDEVDPARDLLPIASCGSPTPAISASVSSRRSASPGELACTVESAPSWPVLSAVEQVERLRPADLADHDPVGAHPQRVAEQVADRHLPPALDARRAALEPDDVRLAQAKLGRVLDRDHPLPGGRCSRRAR